VQQQSLIKSPGIIATTSTLLMTVTSVMITASTLICLEIVLSIKLPPRRREATCRSWRNFFQNPRRDFNQFRKRFESWKRIN